MRALLKIFFYLIVSLFIGLLVAPGIYHFVLGLSAGSWGGFWGPLGKGVAAIERMPFYRYASRSVEITCLIFLIPLLHWLDLPEWQKLFPWPKSWGITWKEFYLGLFAAFFPLLLLGLLWLRLGIFVWNEHLALIVFMRIVLTAILVAVMEEFLFRGFLLHLLLQKGRLSAWAAIVVSSLIFSLIHFAGIAHYPLAKESISWQSGLTLILHLAEGLPPLPLFIGAALNLFAIGCLLAWVTEKKRSLALPIGLHAGWIMAQQTLNSLTHFSINLGIMGDWPWIAPAQVHGMVPVGVWVLVPFLVTFFLIKKITKAL